MLETKIFKPYNPKIDTEEWPQLDLIDVVIYKHVAGRPDELCDLLDVQFTGPVRITGTVRKIPAKFNKMVKDLPVIGGNDISSKTAAALAKSVHGATVTIIDVLTYSLQSYKEPESDSTIWALGYAAWYSILPAPGYRKYFDRSLEKAHIWDIVLEFGKSQEFRQVTMEQLFAKYFQKHPNCKSVDGAEMVFRECRRFLVCKMLEPIDPLAGPKSKNDKTRWQKFCLWKWLTANYPGIFKEVEKAIQGGKTGGESSTDKRAFSLDTQHGLDSLESLVLEQKLKPHHLTTQWLVSSIRKKSGVSASIASLRLQKHANVLSTLMALSRQVNWVQSSLYSDLLLASKEAPSGNGEGSSHALKVKKNGGSGKGEAATTVNPNSFADALDGVNDMEQGNDMDQDNDLFSTPELSQPPKSAKGKSVLRPIMTPLQRESGQEDEISSPLSSPPVSLPSTPVTVEQLVAPGPSTLPKRRQISGATNSHEPAKRSRVSKGPELKGTSGGDEDEDDWPPLSPGRGRPPIVVSRQISMKPIGDGTFWRCRMGDCLTIIPDAHTPAGRVLIEQHLGEHYLTLERASHALEEEPETKGRSLDALLDKIEKMAKEWQAVREEHNREFHEMHATMLQGERERGEVFLAPSTPKKDLDNSNGKGKEKEK